VKVHDVQGTGERQQRFGVVRVVIATTRGDGRWELGG
jgi:hypothetical protein